MNLKHIISSIFLSCIFSNSISQENKINTSLEKNAVFGSGRQDPSYPGGITALYEYINKNLKYPDWEKENKIQGRITTNFIVEKDGTISNVKILRSVPNSKNMDAEAIRLVKNMPKWIPGKRNDSIVRVSYSIPIIFSYEKADAERLLKENPDYIFNTVDKVASFSGGTKAQEAYIRNKTKDLDWLINDFKLVKGKFIVEKDGSLSEITLTSITELSKNQKKQLLKIIKDTPNWIPAQVGSVTVRSYQTISLKPFQADLYINR